MDPIIENDWLGPKQEAIEEVQNVPNLTRSWLGREMDIEPLRGPANKTVLENLAEDILVQKTLTSRVSSFYKCITPPIPIFQMLN